MLQDLSVPYEMLDQCKGADCCHHVMINKFYDDLVNTLTYDAQEAIPVMSVNT